MHPLELQVNDLKAIVQEKEKRLKKFEKAYRSIVEQLEELKAMLHPSRQKKAEALRRTLEATLDNRQTDTDLS
jgi:lipoate-protein ligase A